MIRGRISGLWIIIFMLVLFGGIKWVCGQVPFSDIDATGCTTIDIITSCKGIVLRDANGKAKLVNFDDNTMTPFQLPKIPTQSICWFSKAILSNGKWAAMVNSVEGADYRCQIYDIDGNKYLDVDGQGDVPNNTYLVVRSYNRVRVYKTKELKIMPTDIKPKIKYKSLKGVVLRDGVYDSRGRKVPSGTVVLRELLPSGFYIDIKNNNKIIFVE